MEGQIDLLGTDGVPHGFLHHCEGPPCCGATPKNCGKYLMHDLPMARWEAAKFAEYLEENAGRSILFEYPKAERLQLDDGQQFFDS